MIKKIGSAVAGAAIFGSLLVPAAFADTTINISRNGADSKNTVDVSSDCDTTMVQKNKTNVKTNVSVSGKTGGNDANGNTGGDVTVESGDVTNNVTISVGGSTNMASDVPDCCACEDGNTSVNVRRNGAGSNNKVTEVKTTSTTVKQKNKTKVSAKVKAKGKTGKNDANNNTDGTVEVTSGEVENTVDVTVSAPSNTL